MTKTPLDKVQALAERLDVRNLELSVQTGLSGIVYPITSTAEAPVFHFMATVLLVECSPAFSPPPDVPLSVCYVHNRPYGNIGDLFPKIDVGKDGLVFWVGGLDRLGQQLHGSVRLPSDDGLEAYTAENPMAIFGNIARVGVQLPSVAAQLSEALKLASLNLAELAFKQR